MKFFAKLKNPARVAVPDTAEAREALVVLEQMYGYFSFDPMPLEADTARAA